MASVASELIEEVTAHVQSNSLEDAREICADGTYFLSNLRNNVLHNYSFNVYFTISLIFLKGPWCSVFYCK